MITEITISFISTAIVIASVTLRNPYPWFRCPMCRKFHNGGNHLLAALPPEADGTVRPCTCKECSDTNLPNETTEPQKNSR
jgi:hypothetical protein